MNQSRLSVRPVWPVPMNLPGSLGIPEPAGVADPVRLAQGQSRLMEAGLNSVRPKPHPETWPGYLAGSEIWRAEVMNQMIRDSDLDGILCARGGFGSMGLLPLIDWDGVAQVRKPVVGFSDITAFLNAMVTRAGVVGFHGPVVTQLADADARTLTSLTDTLLGKYPGSIGGLTCLRGGIGSGTLMGGNLSTLASMIGTSWYPDLAETVLFLEDVNEPLYRIDRMLLQLKMAGCLSGVNGIVLGNFSNGPSMEDVERLFLIRTADSGIPVVSGLPIGHTRINICLPVGAQVLLRADDGHLEITL